MALLIINFGSSSLKVSVYQEEKILLDIKTSRDKFASLVQKLHERFSFQAIAHRFVHGGAHTQPLLIRSKKDLHPLKKLLSLAPLHNPYCYEGIERCLELFHVVNIAIFDTSFFHHIPLVAQDYALPRSLMKKYQLRRYGFHGLAHEALLRSVTGKKVITAHLGSGASLAAHLNGSPIDISMGFTPLEGLVMATRGGDIDPGIIAALSHKEDLEDLLNHHSGLKGLTRQTSMEKIIKNPRHKHAINLYCYRLTKYIGSYIAALEGCDTLVFSGGIGENCAEIRKRVVPSWFGATLDSHLNCQTKGLKPGEKRLISKSSSPLAIWVVGAHENELLAQHALHALVCKAA